MNKKKSKFSDVLSDVYGLLPVLFIAAVFSVKGMNKVLSSDEIYSVNIALDGFRNVINNLRFDTGTPLYPLILSLWIKIFGISESGLRGLSACIYLGSAAAVYYLVKIAFKDRFQATLLALFYALGNITINHASNARMYGLLGFLGIISFICVIKTFILKEKKYSIMISFILINIAGTFTHYWYFFNLLPQYIFLIIYYRKEFVKINLLFLLSVLPFFVLWLPVLLKQSGNILLDWMRFNGQEISSTISYFLYDRRDKFFGILALLFAGGYLINSVNFGIRKANKEVAVIFREYINDRTVILFMISLAAMLIVPYLFSRYIKPVYIVERGPIITYLPFVLVFGTLIIKFLKKGFVLFLAVFFTVCVFAVFFKAGGREYPDYRDAAKIIMLNAGSGGTIIYPGVEKYNIDYYLRKDGSDKKVKQYTFPAEKQKMVNWAKTYKQVSPEMESELQAQLRQIKGGFINNKSTLCTYGPDGGMFPDYVDKAIREYFVLKKKVNIGNKVLRVYSL